MTKPRVQNITRAFRAANTDELLSGMDWYARARRLAVTLDPENPARAAGIIAVLSPLNGWPNNVQQARNVYAGVGAKGLGNSVRKAHAIYAGAIPEEIVSGPKVISFYTNIISPENGTPVTIDRHAIDIACWRVQSDSDRASVIKGKAGYARLSGMYRRAAEILSAQYGVPILPQQVQAVTWIYWRNNHAKYNHGEAASE